MPPTVLVVMGVSGSGKSTIGGLLAERLGWPYAEGDAFHSAANVAKMAAGHPLDDNDRRPWLQAVRNWISERLDAGESGVVTCSALRLAYRDVLRSATNAGAGVVRFVFLDVDRSVLHARLVARHGHFMGANMLDSQLATLERPLPVEHAITIRVSADTQPATAVDEVLADLASVSE